MKTYLIVSIAERCPREVYAYRHKVFKEFLLMTGDLPFCVLNRKHIQAFAIQKIREVRWGEKYAGCKMNPLVVLRDFIRWSLLQPGNEKREFSDLY